MHFSQYNNGMKYVSNQKPYVITNNTCTDRTEDLKMYIKYKSLETCYIVFFSSNIFFY